MAIEIGTAEEFVALAASVMNHPTLEEVEAMLKYISVQDRDWALGGMEDALLDMRTDLQKLAA